MISHVVSDILCRVEREIVSEMLSLFGLSFKFLFLCPLLHVRSYNITVSLFELKALSYMEGTKLTLKNPKYLQLKKTMSLQHQPFFSAVTDSTHFCLDEKKCHKYFHVTFIYAI